MKFQHTIHGLSTVSFSTRDQINPVTGQPTGVVIDNWEEISGAAARGLEEIQNRIIALEELIKKMGLEDNIVKLLEATDILLSKDDEGEPPAGVPVEQIKARRKRMAKA